MIKIDYDKFDFLIDNVRKLEPSGLLDEIPLAWKEVYANKLTDVLEWLLPIYDGGDSKIKNVCDTTIIAYRNLFYKLYIKTDWDLTYDDRVLMADSILLCSKNFVLDFRLVYLEISGLFDFIADTSDLEVETIIMFVDNFITKSANEYRK